MFVGHCAGVAQNAWRATLNTKLAKGPPNVLFQSSCLTEGVWIWFVDLDQMANCIDDAAASACKCCAEGLVDDMCVHLRSVIDSMGDMDEDRPQKRLATVMSEIAVTSRPTLGICLALALL